MANTRTYNRSFAGGELSPEMFGRIDDVKFQTGAATLRNFVATPQGPAENRPGFAYVNATKGNGVARLISFTYSTDQTMVIELGPGYFRFHTQGATLLNGSVPYEIANPYAQADLFDIHYVQSADVLTLVHPNYPPAELRRLGATNWTFASSAFAPLITPPSVVTVTPSPGYKSKVASISLASPAVITTVANHTLVLGDGIYIAGLTATIAGVATVLDGFYLVAKVPEDGTGAAILNQLIVMDYDGNNLDSSAWDSYTWGTIQYGSKVYDINSHYVVTSISADGVNESVISAEVSALNNLDVTGSYNTTSWQSGWSADVCGIVADPTGGIATIALGTGQSAIFQVGDSISYTIPNVNLGQLGNTITSIPDASHVVVACGVGISWTVAGTLGTITKARAGAGQQASRYRVYKKKNGLYGFIGETTERSFVDNNIAPDMGITPPTYDTVFASVGNYPGAVSYFQQRKCFAGSRNQPQNFWMSKSGTESNFSYSLPTTDADRIAVRVAAREANTIRHIVPLTQLLMMTSAAEIRVSPVNSEAITPTSIDARPQSYVGASNVQPAIVNNSLVYCAARGGHVCELGYSWQASGFITGDLSLRAAHLFDNLLIVDQCFVKAPRPIVWFVSSSGKLLGLTYIPEQQIGAWHWHDTDGIFESITAVAEGREDRLYAVVRRTVNGQTVRYVERMASRVLDQSDPATWFFVDAGATYSGSPATTISGLTWLEGKTVSILADGAVCPPQIVTSGAITLPHPASVVQVGLPIIADLETLPPVMQIDGYGQGRQKNINKCWLKLWRSSGLQVGPDAAHLTEYKQRSTEQYGTPPALKSEEIQVMSEPSWQASGKVFIRQSQPLPLTVVGLTLEVAIGG